MKRLRLLPVLTILVACATGDAAAADLAPPAGTEFAEYWYRGAAEITSYRLEQARYGEVHEGRAVLIFVTEDFSRDKQVKLDSPPRDPVDAIPVLKLNLTRKFNTGIYPYSMMTSAFTPVDRSSEPRTLKVTTSSQEWCGHTFTQLNAIPDGYRLQENSYFEAEGDRVAELGDAVPEDGLWNLIRIDPSALPTGELKLVPGSMFQRLRHAAWRVRDARAELGVDGNGLMRYTIQYPDLGRTLEIRFEAEFPFEIESWEETYRSGFGPGAKPLTTRAVRDRRIQLDYWNRHGVADEGLRAELGLE